MLSLALFHLCIFSAPPPFRCCSNVLSRRIPYENCAHRPAVDCYSPEGLWWTRVWEPSRLPLFPRERCNIEKRKNKRLRQEVCRNRYIEKGRQSYGDQCRRNLLSG